MPEKIKGLSELLDSKMNQHSVVHPMSSEEYELYMIKKQNDQPGKLDGLDCSICKIKATICVMTVNITTVFKYAVNAWPAGMQSAVLIKADYLKRCKK